MNGFLTQCKVRKAELLQCIGFLAAAYLLGLVILCIVMNVAKGEGSATVGTGMAVVFFFFLHLFGIAISFMQEFNVAVSMGATRKSFVASYALFNLLEIAVLELEVILFGWFEKLLIGVFFPHTAMELDITVFFTWKYLLGVMLGFTILELFAGAVILKYGMKVLWVFWALWMAACLLPVRIAHNEKNYGKTYRNWSVFWRKNHTAGNCGSVDCFSHYCCWNHLENSSEPAGDSINSLTKSGELHTLY